MGFLLAQTGYWDRVGAEPAMDTVTTRPQSPWSGICTQAVGSILV